MKLGEVPFIIAIDSVIINTAVCYRIACPVPEIGITLSPGIPVLVAATCGIIFMLDIAPSIAFSSGVLGPLIGADLLHIRKIIKTARVGVVSTVGTETFDGIVILGIVATLLV